MCLDVSDSLLRFVCLPGDAILYSWPHFLIGCTRFQLTITSITSSFYFPPWTLGSQRSINIKINLKTRKHSSRIRTGHLLTGGSLGCEYWEWCPGVCVSRGVTKGGVCPGGTHTQTQSQTPCELNDWQTGVKTLPFRNSVCRGKYMMFLLLSLTTQLCILLLTY